MKTLLWNIWKVGRWIVAAFVVLFIGLVLYRIPAVIEEDKTAEAVKYIQEQKITLADVTGERLPPRPDQTLADATIEGIDTNKNGIRDDVERAIFDRYPGNENIKIRAAMLQYAKEQQVYLTSVFNSETWVAAIKHRGKGIGCLVDVAFEKYTDIKDQINKSDEWREYVDGLIFDSDQRLKKKEEADRFEAAYAGGGGDMCDVEL